MLSQTAQPPVQAVFSRSSQLRRYALPGLLLAGWALYITVVAASNMSDLAASFGWENWAFRSGNLDYIETATKIYFQAPALNQLLLAVVIVWEVVAAVLCWRAAVTWVFRGPVLQQARNALLTLTMLWFAFGISTELFVAYDRGVDESAYWTLAIAVLASLTVIELTAARDTSGQAAMSSPVADQAAAPQP